MVLELVLDLDLDPGSGLDLALYWSPDRHLRILYLRYTGFKGFILASTRPRLGRPRIGYARLVVARNPPYYSTILDSNSVIYLGHIANVPLIGLLSELVNGLEPHDHILSGASPASHR